MPNRKLTSLGGITHWIHYPCALQYVRTEVDFWPRCAVGPGVTVYGVGEAAEKDIDNLQERRLM